MLFQPIRLGLIVDHSKLNPTIINKLHISKIFIKIRNSKDLRKYIELSRIVDLEGIYITLGRILRSRIVRDLTEIGEFKIILYLDSTNRSSAIKEFVTSLAYVHEVIPVIDPCKGVENIYVANIPTINSIIIDISKVPKDPNERVIRSLEYLRDCLNNIFKIRNITLGVIISRSGLELFELLKDILTLSSYIYVKDSVEEVLILQNILEKTRSTSQIFQAISQILCSGDVKVEVNIE